MKHPLSCFSKKQFFESFCEKRFTLLVFYRGSWCCYCEEYLMSMNQVVSKVESLGGKMVAISAQDTKTVKQTEESLQLNFPLISDEKNKLAKQCHVAITKKNTSLFQKLLNLARQSKARMEYLENEQTYAEGISQPAIVVWDSKKNIIFQWKSFPMLHNMFGATHRLPIAEVMAVIEYLLPSSTLEEKMRRIKVKQDSNADLFDLLILDSQMQLKFMDHLRREYTAEMLDFLVEVGEWRKMEHGVEKKEKEKHIYRYFIKEDSLKEVNLPAWIKVSLRRKLEPSADNLIVRTTSTMPNLQEKRDIFHDAYIHIKDVLFVDSYVRYQQHPSFMELTLLAPQYFEV